VLRADNSLFRRYTAVSVRYRLLLKEQQICYYLCMNGTQINLKELPCRKLAFTVGVDPSQMSRFLNRKSTPGLHTFYKLVQAVSDILGRRVSLEEMYRRLYFNADTPDASATRNLDTVLERSIGP